MLKQIIKNLLPHGIIRAVQRRDESRRRSYAVLNRGMVTTQKSYADLFSFLVARGLDREQVKGGSMPQSSLEFIAQVLQQHSSQNQVLRGIHVGNFLGVSLAHITMSAKSIHEDSFVVAVDPNLEHRGISHPQDHVCALLDYCGLNRNVLLVCGYSTEKSVANDGRNYLEDCRELSADEVTENLQTSFAPAHVLANVSRICGEQKLDFALVDGNHDSVYVESELAALRPLLRKGALVFMDDVNEGWPNLKALFDRGASGYQAFANDERIGILTTI